MPGVLCPATTHAMGNCPTFALAALLATGMLGANAAAVQAAESCTKAEFESVVEDAAGALRDLNLKNRPLFQEKLRMLKTKMGWSHDVFMKEAAPFVRDDTIAGYDQTTDDLLGSIAAMGAEGANAPAADCARLMELRGRMKVLVDTQIEKWNYMFHKIDAELAK